MIGGLGASLLLPSMQALIHGNFEGPAQRRVYAMVGAAAAIAAAVGPLIGGFITRYLSWRVGFILEAVVIGIVLLGIGLVRDVPYTGPRGVDVVGAALSALGMGGVVLGIIAWQEGVGPVVAIIVVGAACLAGLAAWLIRRRRAGELTLIDPDLFRKPGFRIGVSQQLLQQIALGGAMIVLPIFFQIVLEYDALAAGVALAPLSLSMFALAMLMGKRGGGHRPATLVTWGFGLLLVGMVAVRGDRAAGRERLGVPGAARRRRIGARAPRLPAQQLHAVADRRGAGQRGRRRQLGRRLLRALVRPRPRRRADAGDPCGGVHDHGRQQRGPAPGGQGPGRRRPSTTDAQLVSNTNLEELLADEPPAVQAEIIRINTDARPLALQVALLVPILAAAAGLLNGLRMRRLPDPEPSTAAEGMVLGG